MIKLKLSDISAHLDDVKEGNGSLSPLKGITGTTPRGSVNFSEDRTNGHNQTDVWSPEGFKIHHQNKPAPSGAPERVCVCVWGQGGVCNKAVIYRRGDGDTWGGGLLHLPSPSDSFLLLS